MSELNDRLQLALSAAREAGEITLRFFRGDNLDVERKDDDSPVTVADRQAEELLRQRIDAAFPDDGVLGEEFGEKAGTSPFRWILDPIDGTQSFIHGVPLYGMLIGVERDGEPAIGVINMPALDERVYAAAGEPAWYQRGDEPSRKARVSGNDNMAAASLLTSELEGFEAVGRWDVLQKLQSSSRLARTWGDCYGYLLVATGRADVMIDPRMQLWDAAALKPILEAAGGTFTDWQGQATIHSGNGIATNGKLLDDVLRITRAER